MQGIPRNVSTLFRQSNPWAPAHESAASPDEKFDATGFEVFIDDTAGFRGTLPSTATVRSYSPLETALKLFPADQFVTGPGRVIWMCEGSRRKNLWSEVTPFCLSEHDCIGSAEHFFRTVLLSFNVTDSSKHAARVSP